MLPPPRSLRLWIHSSSLLAILAGYALLLVVGAGLTALERRQTHRQLVEELSDQIKTNRWTVQSSGKLSLLGVNVWTESGYRPTPTRIRHNRGQIYLESRRRLNWPGHPPQLLVVSQDVTKSIRRERTLQLLLVAAAGSASLFTSILLRPVLRHGLVSPISDLCQQLQTVTGVTLGNPEDLPADHPEELVPIVDAFNALLHRLSRAWQQERIFADGMAHELRTPITLISGHAQSLLRQTLRPDVHEGLRQIDRESGYISRLIRDFLDLSRRDAGVLELARCSFDPETGLLEAFDRFRPVVGDRLRLVEANGPRPGKVLADPDRLVQCLLALVENAISYSTGPIDLWVEVSDEQVIWHVRDHGEGVPVEERERIFQRFVRGSAAGNGQHRGSGLGLALVRLLMEGMGGAVHVQDAEGCGADFQLRIPSLEATTIS